MKHTIQAASKRTDEYENIATVTDQNAARLIAQALTAWTRRPHRAIIRTAGHVEHFYGQMPDIQTPIQISTPKGN